MPPDRRNAAAPGTATGGDEKITGQEIATPHDTRNRDNVASAAACPMSCAGRDRCVWKCPEVDTDDMRQERLIRWSAEVSAAIRKVRRWSE